MTSTETPSNSGSSNSGGGNASGPSAPQQPVVTTDPDTGRPVPPDVLPSSVHNPGGAPGAHILTGPAEMTVGSRKGKKGDGGKKSGSSSK